MGGLFPALGRQRGAIERAWAGDGSGVWAFFDCAFDDVFLGQEPAPHPPAGGHLPDTYR